MAQPPRDQVRSFRDGEVVEVGRSLRTSAFDEPDTFDTGDGERHLERAVKRVSLSCRGLTYGEIDQVGDAMQQLRNALAGDSGDGDNLGIDLHNRVGCEEVGFVQHDDPGTGDELW